LSFGFRIARRAEIDIRAAAEWWLTNRTDAPLLFAEDLKAAFDLIEQFPHAGEAVAHRRIGTVRRVLLGRVQYHLYYSVKFSEQIIEVLALWHTSRGSKPRL
jgi:plasmid stabilization system protein ParE